MGNILTLNGLLVVTGDLVFRHVGFTDLQIPNLQQVGGNVNIGGTGLNNELLLGNVFL